MKTIRSALLGLSLALAPFSLHAQEAASIVGFSGMPWGTTEAAVRERAGEPVQVEMVGPMRVLLYSDQVLGQTVTTWYYLHPEHNLVAGAYIAPYGVGEACWTVYSGFKNAVTERYPALRPSVQEQNRSQLDLCSGVAINMASVSTQWDDPANGARVLIELKNDPDFVVTLYMSAEGIRQIEGANAAQRQQRF